jgi:hypothetical protein
MNLKRMGKDMNAKMRRELIFETLEACLQGFLVTDRKEDKNLPLGEIEAAVRDWDMTVAEMTLYVSEWFRKRIPVPSSGEEVNSGKSWTGCLDEDPAE